jgi:hypothetical protein
MSEENILSRMAAAQETHKDAVIKLPSNDGKRVSVTKRSATSGNNSSGHVIVFRDAATEFKYTVSVSVSVSSAKPLPGEEGEPKAKATSEDIACFEGTINEFLSSIQKDIK